VKLYLSPGACSLAAHIALHEADADFEHERVDLKSKRTASGSDYTTINPKGYVPALVLDEGQPITENVAVLDWIAQKYSLEGFDGPLARTRLLETAVRRWF
jgi:glutathione S-transferase